MADAKGNIFESNILAMIFNASSIAGLCDPDATSPLATLSVQLHTASPGEGGDLTTSEANYSGYARVGVERTSSGWTVTTPSSGTSGSVNPTATITFPQCNGATTSLVTHFSIGNTTVAASTGVLYYYGTVSPNITVSNGVTPRLTTATAITEL